MMVAIFTSMVLALVAARWGPRWLGVAALIVCLALSMGEFLYEIDSPVDGFRLPWLQAMIHGDQPRMSEDSTIPARLADLALLAILTGLAAILTTAMILQYASGEIPCPLCLLQRVAMFGVCFGIIHHFRGGYDVRNVGVGLVWALYLLMVSVRQVLLNIVARPGHAYPGSAVFGLHMPVWSVVIAFAVLLTFAATLAAFDGRQLSFTAPSPVLTRIGNFAGFYVIALCLINLLSAILQCGIGACHTTGYALL